jgi:hypothetical protein
VSRADLSRFELPPFDGPLVAFVPAPDDAPGGPVYLGGDLHRVHPDAAEQYSGRARDKSLDEARIVLADQEHEDLEATAIAGVWCMALHGDLVDSAPYFAGPPDARHRPLLAPLGAATAEATRQVR